MTDEKYTRCPSCSTIFRVTEEQLALRDGKVRCGHCRTVFDGVGQLISLAPVARPEPDIDLDDLAKGPPTITLRPSRALRPAPVDDEEEDEEELEERNARMREQETAEDYERRFAWDKPKPRSRAATALYAIAIPVLAIALIGQVAYHFRDGLAAHWPVLRPALTRMCTVLGCTVRPLRDVAGLSIDASELQADPAHKGLLILSATIRNRAGYSVAYPYLELTLKDSADQVVVRRALAPTDYVSGTADIANGIAGNGEVVVKLFIDASATTQSGYLLYLFYP
jgi:predicted Zn finger-like uncharacterized protein